MAKRKYILAVLSALCAFMACENADFLNRTPFSQTSPEDFYKSENEMYMALVSCYETMNTEKIPGNGTAKRGSYNLGLWYLMNGPSDEVVTSKTDDSDEGTGLECAIFSESTRVIRDFWKVFYTGINRCNIVLHYIDDIPDMSDEQKNRYRAEARFMRAFFYYHLAWNFGGVPIVTDHLSDGQEPRSSLEDVYDFIFDDLLFARDNITDDGLIPDVSANRYTVLAYIGRICNYLYACSLTGTGRELVAGQPLNDFSFVSRVEMNQMSRDALKVVAESSRYQLIPDYTNLFRETTKSEQHKECLFLVESPLSGNEGVWPNSYYIPSPSSPAKSVSPGVYAGRHVPTPRVFYSYHPDDPRRDFNCTGRINDGREPEKTDNYIYYKPAVLNSFRMKAHSIGKDEYDADIFGYYMNPLINSQTQTYLPTSGLATCPGKFRMAAVGQLQHSYAQHAISIPLMRLADVYLMYAEALYFNGDEPTARTYLDKVLMRAAGNDQALFDKLKSEYRRDNFIDELLESRMRELVFEFSRKWDLIRFNMTTAAIESMCLNSLDEDPSMRFLPSKATVYSSIDLYERKTVMVKDEYNNDVADYELDESKYLQTWTPSSEDLAKFYSISPDGSVYMGTNALKNNWKDYKIWLPISEEQIGVNQSLKQNAGW